MKEHPILFSAPMVRSILDGRKTVTRRVVKPQPHPNHVLSPCWGQAPCGFEFGEKHAWCENGPDYPDNDDDVRRCPYGVPGDRLWVRETWRTEERESDMMDGVRFAADGSFVAIESTREAADNWTDAHENGKHGERWRPSIHMPRWASRLLLEVVSVRVERLQEIDEYDANAEGVSGWAHDERCETARDGFRVLWDEINAKRGFGWASNPWVWRVEFKRIEVTS